MAKFTVTPESLRAAATKLENDASSFESASQAAKTAADALAGNWVGDAQKVFVEEQAKANTWYLKMVAVCREYATALRNAAANYESGDLMAAEKIRAR